MRCPPYVGSFRFRVYVVLVSGLRWSITRSDAVWLCQYDGQGREGQIERQSA